MEFGISVPPTVIADLLRHGEPKAITEDLRGDAETRACATRPEGEA